MIVRTTEEITGTDRDVAGTGWRSKRIVLGGDRVGFSFHETTIEAGTTHVFHYQNHVEAVWLVEGEGTLTDLTNNQTYELGPGSMYLLDGHEKHQLEVRTRMRMMCVFNPPVTGQEVHDENGVYPLVAVPAS
ncbi:ectoine synthase [Nocardia cyriacigeorgica]|jgi:L-ectoine synthase|uniref:L-ectoine synthase n=2 Tax=Nocardia cyriacigeorgica TaxID=135487 RepID=H6RDA4_NOCCG|nr:ectoine synthase [Nocardia cyriacigeorgica]AVH23461.1 ectoine synthase [Nocardia cyriacigeorgica]MBF6080372.1 ectoine synthase [Nocardia cyriacigeorgica]MBF6088291.1 ectoine synthase [Nocardia cyriacigeorgica]MBF6095398.1 ectoine synthase [Nocardia cyriacigeorgica]MBF6096546.1 ectoine synthase [Nocardia cyriacigeorgica]